MKTKHFALLALSIFTLFVTVSFKKMANPVMGKWQLNTKIEQKIQDGVLMESNQKNYKAGKKIYEFAAENKLMITEDYGKTKEKKKYVTEGMSVYIGKEQTPDNLYTCTFSENNTKLTLLRTKTKTKEGKTTVETDELRLERIKQ